MFEPIEFAAVAKRVSLDVELDAEARARAAWGRCYYSLFLAVREAIMKSRSGETRFRHADLWNALYETGDDDMLALGKLLESLYTRRMHADYEVRLEGRWKKEMRPRKAERKARTVEAVIRTELTKLDFASVRIER